MKCKHKRVTDWRMPVHVRDRDYDGMARMSQRIICDGCGAWLPLGPARDTDATRIEARAAELAVLPAGAFATSDAVSGWVCATKGLDLPPWPHCPEAWSAWLAFYISWHESSPEAAEDRMEQRRERLRQEAA